MAYGHSGSFLKRILATALILAILPLSIFAGDFYYGGPARLLSLGGPGAAMFDISSAADGYSAGFASAIFARPAVNVITLNPQVIALARDGAQWPGTLVMDWRYKTANVRLSNEDVGIIYRLDEDTSFVIKPYAGFYGNDPFFSDHSAGGFYAEAAQRFFGRFCAAISGGWYRLNYSEPQYSKNMGFYQVSLSLLPEAKDGWAYSVSAGNKGKSALYSDYKLLRFDAAASMRSAGDIEMLFKIGTGPGYSEDIRRYGFTFTQSQPVQADAEASVKKVFGPITYGLKLNAKYGTSITGLDSAAGVMVRITDTIALPFEAGYAFIKKNRDYNNQGYDLFSAFYKVSLGAELNISPEMAIRAGINCDGQNDEYTNIDEEYGFLITETTGAVGTKDNPLFLSPGLNIGAGYKAANFEVNIGARYARHFWAPEDKYHMDMLHYGIVTIISDFKYYY